MGSMLPNIAAPWIRHGIHGLFLEERKWTVLGSDLDGVLFGDISGVAKNWPSGMCRPFRITVS
jgi:hypothetical protein